MGWLAAKGAWVPIRIVRGLDIPIAGAPDQVVGAAPEVTSVALLGGDYPGLRPAMRVAEGDRVRLGQALVADRRRPRIVFTAPGAGTVAAINRGARRALQSVVLRLDGDAAAVRQPLDAHDVFVGHGLGIHENRRAARCIDDPDADQRVRSTRLRIPLPHDPRHRGAGPIMIVLTPPGLQVPSMARFEIQYWRPGSCGSVIEIEPSRPSDA